MRKTLSAYFVILRDGPLEKLWEEGGGGGRAGEVQKNYLRKGKLNEKKLCTSIDPKKYSCFGLKEIRTRNLITKKNSCGSKIPLPPPPNNLSNGPSLSQWKITLGKEEIYPRGDGNRLSATFPWREKNNPPSH